MKKDTAYKVLFFIAFAALFAVIIVNVYDSQMNGVEWQEQSYCVQAGDCFWSLADEYCPQDIDCREWIEAVKELNGMDSSRLRAGETITLLIPTDKEVKE